jgi:hypothetical protein
MFPLEIHEKIKFYVYRLIDPRNGETFYVGKGCGDRVFHHAAANDSAFKDFEADASVLNARLGRIRDIIADGLEVIRVIHRHGMTEDEALHVEAALIDAYPGLTNLQGSHGNSEFGCMPVQAIIQKYQARELDAQHSLIAFLVRAETIKERGLYQACAAAWKVNVVRARECEFVLLVRNGIVAEVFKPTEWLAASRDHFPWLEEADDNYRNRWGFVGEPAEAEVREMYLGARIPTGGQMPIRYFKKGQPEPKVADLK